MRFPILPSIRHLSYQLGGIHAFRTEGAPGSKASSDPSRGSIVAPAALATRDIPPFGLILGAMKCGTSALYRGLMTHPQVSASKIKEPSFFTSEADLAKGSDWYLDLYHWDPRRHHIAIEATTRHTQHPFFRGAADRMKAIGWSFRFVYVIRNPIERIQSHYLDASARRLELRPLSEGLADFPLNVSRYWTQLRPYATAFGPAAILVITREELLERPKETMNRLCRHFGIDPEPAIALEPVHVSDTHYRPRLVAQELASRGLVEAQVSTEDALDMLRRIDPVERASVEAAAAARYTLTDAHKADIRRVLAEDMRRLSADYGIDVARWGFET